MKSLRGYELELMLFVLMIILVVTSPEGARGGTDNTSGVGATSAINDYQFAVTADVLTRRQRGGGVLLSRQMTVVVFSP